MNYLLVLEVGRLKWFHWLARRSGHRQGCTPSAGSGRESISLTFLAFRGFQHPSAHGPLPPFPKAATASSGYYLTTALWLPLSSGIL